MPEPAEDFIEVLQAWLAEHRRSPLDGTISCKICCALVLDGENAAEHYRWHHDGQKVDPVRALQLEAMHRD